MTEDYMTPEDIELIDHYYRASVKRGQYMLPEAVGGTFPFMLDLIQKHAGKLVVSHDGTLTGPQKRAWGRNPFITAGLYKSDLVTHPANLIPCLLTALDTCKDYDVPLKALTIGPMNLKSGEKRTSAWRITQTLLSVVLSAADHPLKENPFVEIWEERYIENNYKTQGIWHHHRFDNLFKEWAGTKNDRLYITDDLKKARDENDQWGTW